MRLTRPGPKVRIIGWRRRRATWPGSVRDGGRSASRQRALDPPPGAAREPARATLHRAALELPGTLLGRRGRLLERPGAQDDVVDPLGPVDQARDLAERLGGVAVAAIEAVGQIVGVAEALEVLGVHAADPLPHRVG